ncbi:MAG TPA: glycosyltransferase [Angustibacter sp.]|nr:glycosyltransferase [Angustibacter sp.]
MTSRKPHVLLLGMQFPPARGSGVYRIRAWANHLVRKGLDVTVLAADRSYWHALAGEVDEDLVRTVDPRVRVIEVKVPREHLIQDVRSMSWLHASFPKAYLTAHEKFREAVFPEPYAPMIPSYVRHGLSVHLRHRVDVVLATGNPYAQYAAAHLVSRAIRRPYVVDYHDPWTLNLWTEEDHFPPGHPAFRWERRIIDGASLVVTVNSPLVQWYRDRYPEAADRVRLVENGLAEEVVGDPGFTPVPAGRPLRAAFLGTIRGDLPLQEYLDGWALARQHPSLADATMDFYGYLGFFKQHAQSIRSRIEGDSVPGVTYRGPVSQTQIGGVLGAHDIMAMLLTSSRFVTAGKGFDYMASGRPVVGVHDPRNDTTSLFRDYPLFYGVKEVTPEGVRDALLQAADAARSETREQYDAARAEAMRHTWDAAIAPVADEIEGIARG